MVKYWSSDAARKSNALDLEEGVFTWNDPEEIAKSLKASAEASTRRKGTPYQSAMSMLSFYVNRAGSRLTKEQSAVLAKAKANLRQLFGR
jgi:putative cell wall-binding protein